LNEPCLCESTIPIDIPQIFLLTTRNHLFSPDIPPQLHQTHIKHRHIHPVIIHRIISAIPGTPIHSLSLKSQISISRHVRVKTPSPLPLPLLEGIPVTASPSSHHRPITCNMASLLPLHISSSIISNSLAYM